jgi:hypothetical protein
MEQILYARRRVEALARRLRRPPQRLRREND